MFTMISYNIKTACLMLCRATCRTTTWRRDLWGCPVVSGIKTVEVDPWGPVNCTAPP